MCFFVSGELVNWTNWSDVQMDSQLNTLCRYNGNMSMLHFLTIVKPRNAFLKDLKVGQISKIIIVYCISPILFSIVGIYIKQSKKYTFD